MVLVGEHAWAVGLVSDSTIVTDSVTGIDSTMVTDSVTETGAALTMDMKQGVGIPEGRPLGRVTVVFTVHAGVVTILTLQGTETPLGRA